ncbi:MAG: hypothetical protein OXH00_22735 [Candidatus Poribacteria bacterium]|nr:hypothetical protein [Candidatus Poribacteria bacterium]
MGIIEWLNANSGVIIGVATVVLVGITGIYVYLTWRLLKANNTPEIAISLRCHEAYVSLVMICVENIGTGAARNLRFGTKPSSIPCLDIPFEKIGFLKGGIAYFEPGRKIEQFLVNVMDKYDELKQIPLEITVKYKDVVDREHERTFHLDFSENEGFSHIGRPPLFEIAEATKKLQEDVNSIATGTRKPVILTEPVFEHRIRRHTDFLESRISQYPRNIQEKILQKVDFLIQDQDREIREKSQKDETETDANAS